MEYGGEKSWPKSDSLSLSYIELEDQNERMHQQEKLKISAL